jgi:hypothetical protein
MRQDPPRWANASHLFGLSAECSLKALIRMHAPNKKFSGKNGHLPELWTETMHLAPFMQENGKLHNALTQVKNQFSSWQVAQRYAAETSFAPAIVDQEKGGAELIRSLLKERLQGLR